MSIHHAPLPLLAQNPVIALPTYGLEGPWLYLLLRPSSHLPTSVPIGGD